MGILLFLNRVKNKFDQTTRKTVVESLALSIINYCLPVYCTTNNTLMKQVQKLNFFPPEYVLEERCSATPYITQMNWLKIKQKVVFDVAVAVCKIQNNKYHRMVCTVTKYHRDDT